MQEKTKNRDWVKNAAIIFLAVLLVLTFFSNTIMNRSLPEVATQDVTDGSIVARVRGTGKVTANSNAQVKMEKTRVIRSVLVKVGQQVQAGDVLFTLGEGSSEDIDAAEEKLRTLQTSYNKIAATMPDYSYGADYNRLQHLADALHEAEIAYDAALKAAQQAAPNTVQLENAKKELAQAEEKLKTERLEYDTQLEQVNKSEDIQKLEQIVFGKKGIEEYRSIVRQIRQGQELKDSFSATFKKAIREMDIDKFFRLEELIPKDELVVSYKPEGGKKFVPLSTASAGQKTTAILTFILAYGNVPLILDQPEDDLDNKLVYELVVKRLKIAKRNRQIIVITHNANIPVNGDAEYITSMDSDSVSVKKKYEGTLDRAEIRSEICDVMEGREFAFSMRAHKYHLRFAKE